MPTVLISIAVRHDAIDAVVAALKEYVRATAEAEPQRVAEILRVPYSNRFYIMIRYTDEEDQKQHRQSAAMQDLIRSTRSALTSDLDFIELEPIGSTRG